MTISKRVQQELVLAKPADVVVAPAKLTETPKRITKTFLKASREARTRREAIAARTKGQAWTPEEHARFLEALQIFPSGPWEAVAEYVGTKNSRQTMTHAQKYRQKHERQQRGLRVKSKHKEEATARERAAPYVAVKSEATEEPCAMAPQAAVAAAATPAEEDNDATTVADTVTPAEAASPRSSEDEESEQLLPPPIDLDMFSSSMTLDCAMVDDEPLKLDSSSVLEQLFQDFEPHAAALHIWSTNSLTDKLDELSALPEEFSQSLGLWVP